MNYLFISAAIFVAIILLYSGLKGALHIEEDENPFIPIEEPKTNNLSKPQTPKKRYYKKKKKKPTVAQTAQVEKRPVGRPKKSE